MSLNIFRTAVLAFILLFLMNGLSAAQDNSDSKKMDGHMKMDHSKMKQDKDAKEFDLNAIDKNNDGKVYQCPMDFDVLSDAPGKDPKCGMALEEVSIDKAEENLVSKGFKIKDITEENSIVRTGVINLEKIDANNDGKVYQDMMDYNVISDTPGKCPLCGMTLQEVSLKKAASNLTMNGFKVTE